MWSLLKKTQAQWHTEETGEAQMEQIPQSKEFQAISDGYYCGEHCFHTHRTPSWKLKDTVRRDCHQLSRRWCLPLKEKHVLYVQGCTDSNHSGMKCKMQRNINVSHNKATTGKDAKSSSKFSLLIIYSLFIYWSNFSMWMLAVQLVGENLCVFYISKILYFKPKYVK